MGKRLASRLTPILALALVSWLGAATPKDASVAQLPAQSTTIDDVLVPVPREIFSTLDRFAHSNWRAVQRPELATWKARGDQAQIALLLGAVIAEGFIAVEAEDSAEVKELGRAVLKLSRGLGVEKAALKRSRSIVDHAERADWTAVRKEWNGVLPDVEQGMKALRSDQLAQLVSLGGWLRGAEALAMLISQNYSQENGALLRQPGLLDYMERRLAQMNDDERNDAVLGKMRDGAQKFRSLFGSTGEPLSLEKVKAIGAVSRELLNGLKADSARH